jgi:hypothetical protein
MSVLDQVHDHVRAHLGEESGRAGVSFVGVEPIEVLRFGPAVDGLVRYATLGMARRPMSDPADPVAHGGPRAELVLTLRAPRDAVSKPLAVLAAMPAVEGVVVRPGSSYDLGGPLWPGGAFRAVLVGEPVIAELPTIDEPIRFLGLEPITPEEQAYKRVHGPDALRALWLAQGLDPTDPDRLPARLE